MAASLLAATAILAFVAAPASHAGTFDRDRGGLYFTVAGRLGGGAYRDSLRADGQGAPATSWTLGDNDNGLVAGFDLRLGYGFFGWTWLGVFDQFHVIAIPTIGDDFSQLANLAGVGIMQFVTQRARSVYLTAGVGILTVDDRSDSTGEWANGTGYSAGAGLLMRGKFIEASATWGNAERELEDGGVPTKKKTEILLIAVSFGVAFY